MNDVGKFVAPRRAMELLDVSYSTIRRWEKSHKIKSIVKCTGHKLYDVSSVFIKTEEDNRRKICYCRVSTSKQSNDLENQIIFCQEKFPNHEIIKDIGSSLNWKRKGFITILDSVIKGDIDEVVVSHKDRLCRFGFELIQYICDKFNVKLLVLNQELKTEQQEFTDDII